MWQKTVDRLVYDLMGLSPASPAGAAVDFFIYDTVKIFVLLAAVIFVVAVIRSFFPPEKVRRLLARIPAFDGNVMAALLGTVTPFCSCSAVPLFIGFVEAGIPLGVTFSFLISSPMVNEVALVMLWGLFGWKVAALYLASGLAIAVACGALLGGMRLEKYVEGYVYRIRSGGPVQPDPSWKDRLAYAAAYVREIVGKVWLYAVAGIAIGALMHGYAPADFLSKAAGPGNFFAVPVATLVGVPLYSNAAGVIPIVKVLMDKGMAIGTALAFMMAVTALSLPEAIILRKVLKLRLLVVYFGIVAAGIMLTGYLFNWILA
jgi:uncharacterized membrane protein YraQ (UPF0718 family)